MLFSTYPGCNKGPVVETGLFEDEQPRVHAGPEKKRGSDEETGYEGSGEVDLVVGGRSSVSCWRGHGRRIRAAATGGEIGWKVKAGRFPSLNFERQAFQVPFSAVIREFGVAST